MRPPTQSQKPNILGRVDAELRHLLGIGRDGDEMFGNRRVRRLSGWPASQSRAVCALVMVSSVVKVLEEMMNKVSAGSRSADRLGEIGAVDVGDEAEGHPRSP